MADSTLHRDLTSRDDRVVQLQAALQKLKESELNLAASKAQYSELESILHKQLRQQLLELPESPSCISIKSIGDVPKTDSKLHTKAEDKTANKVASKKSIKSINQVVERPSTIFMKKSSTDRVASLEQLRKSPLQKRILQCHESVEGIAMWSEKMIEKKKYLRQLGKANADSWKNQKLKYTEIAKLETYMDL